MVKKYESYLGRVLTPAEYDAARVLYDDATPTFCEGCSRKAPLKEDHFGDHLCQDCYAD
jgi:hypothetical protein